MLARIARWIMLGLVQLFYPRIEAHGRERAPDGVPIIFVANHPNGLLDALVMMLGMRRHMSFLAKSTFFANPIGRLAMASFEALPVYRQKDEGREGGPRGGRADRNERTFARCRELLGRGRPQAGEGDHRRQGEAAWRGVAMAWHGGHVVPVPPTGASVCGAARP